MKSIYIDKRKGKNVIDNITFKEHKLYEARTIHQVGWTEYVDRESFDELAKELKKLKNDK